MGFVHEITHSNDFIIKNLHEFKVGLEGFRGENGKFAFTYFDFKKRSKNAVINVSSERFERWLENEQGSELDVIEYIQQHIKDDEECIIHSVSYEHGSDMTISKYVITSNKTEEIKILD